MQLAELDLLHVIQVSRGLQHHEQGLAVALDLGTLVAQDGVFDGEGMQPELLGEGLEFLVGRAVQPDPGHRLRCAP